MVYMLRLISGLLIVCLYAVSTTEISESPIQNSNGTTLANFEKTTKDPSSVEFNTLTSYQSKPPITDQDVENIVKPFRFPTESKENNTSLKLKKSEPYTSVKVPNNGANRTSSGRSVDIDVDKFVAPVDHNAVYTLPDTKEYSKEDDAFKSYHSTEEDSPFENLGQLTTPKTPYFDQKFKETVESINRNLKDIPEPDFENSTLSKNYSSDNFIDGLEENSENANLEYKTFEKITNSNETNDNESEKVKETRTITTNITNYNVSTSYEEHTPNIESNELHKETSKRPVNDDNTVNEVKQNPPKAESTIKQNIHVTTLKYSVTKPSTESGDSAIISNKIEGEPTTTPLAILSTASIKPNNVKRGSIKFADYNKIKSNNVSSVSKNQPTEQTVEENQVVPVHVTAPNRESTTNQNHIESSLPDTTYGSENVTITARTESVLAKNYTFEQVEHQSTTVYIFVQPEDIKDLTTIRNEINEVQKTSVASTPRAFQAVSTKDESSSETTIVSKLPQDQKEEISTATDFDERTTAVTSFPRGFSLPTTTDSSTTITEQSSREVQEKLTPNIGDIEKTTTEKLQTSFISSTTETKTTTMQTTSEIPIVTMVEIETTTPLDIKTTSSTSNDSYESTKDYHETTTFSESTTGIPRETTVTDLRSSKNIKFAETTEPFTMQPSDTTTIDSSETTTHIPEDSSGTTTTSRPEDSSETTIFFVDETSTRTESTTEGTTTFPTTLNEISSSSSEEETSEMATKVIVESTPTKTLLENETTAEKTTQESKTTPSTSFKFVHIENIDKNHTTLTPDELKPNEIYTTPVVASESTETVKTTTETPSDDTTSSGLDGPSSGSGAVVAIIISCVGGVCLIALACLLIVMRNRQNSFNYGQRCRPVSLDDYSVDNVSVFNSVRRKAALRGSKRSYGNPAFEDPVCLSHPLNFPAISKFANNQEDVTAEFHDIPQIVARTSELPDGCETKNRYANVIPLPESRVFLNYIDGYNNSDYINANFVTGPKNIRKYYIACQAPMSNTVDDFWRMIWEHQTKVILMLTHLYENGIEKCFDYLPPSEVLDCHRLFGDYQVTLKKREVKEKYIISSIQLKNMVSNSWREVTHFWYMGWPEKGVPTEANSIIAFLIEARSFMKTVTIDKKVIRNGDMNGTVEVNPVVVHCSPGTGRTGAVITCDIAIREFEQTRQVDIPKIVYKIRRDRAGAVQTKEQYAFIYKVIDLYATKLAGGNLESI